MRHNKLWTKVFITAVFGASAHTAYASYTVIDDDLFPTSRAAPSRYEPRSVELQRSERNRTARTEEHYSIPFTKLYYSLSTASRDMLDKLISDTQGAQIRIVGRPDATYLPTGKFASLARQRANMIRTYLMRQGVPAANITTEIDTSPNPQPNGAIYPSEIYISYQEPSSGEQPGFETAGLQSKYQASSAQNVSAPTTFASSANNDYRMIQYINQAVQTGNMSPAVALKLIRDLLDGGPKNSATQNAVLSQEKTRERQQTSRVIVEPITTQPWLLDKRLTLRENVDAWSKAAGWNPSQWDASNPYQVTVTTTLDGGFPDVLRQVADATGLNICAKKREKYVRVTDSNVSCK